LPVSPDQLLLDHLAFDHLAAERREDRSGEFLVAVKQPRVALAQLA
jgi:hypothetical protein